MIETQPTVFIVARPSIDWQGVHGYLEDVGGVSWGDRAFDDAVGWFDRRETPDAELLVEFAGRACYRSWEPGLNANVKRVRDDRGDYLGNVIGSGHGSVLEHAQFTFALRRVSRVFTHELVRHRVGVGISQESLRFVRLTDIGFRVPPVLEPLRERVVSIVETLEDLQRDAAAEFGLDGEGVPFHYKKEVTSALRRLAPIGLSTDMVWSANVRTLRHVLEARTAPGVEEEMRLVFDQVGDVMRREAPALFADFERTAEGAWVPKRSKV